MLVNKEERIYLGRSVVGLFSHISTYTRAQEMCGGGCCLTRETGMSDGYHAVLYVRA